MKIRAKLLLLGFISVIALLISGSQFIIQMLQQEKAYDELEELHSLQFTLRSIQFRFVGISNDERGFLLTGDHEFANGIEEKISEIEQYVTELDQFSIDPENRQALDELGDNLQTYFATNKQMVETYQNGNQDSALEIHMEKQRDIRKDSIDPSIDTLINNVTKTIDENKQLLDKKEQTGRLIIYTLILISILVTSCAAFLIGRSINRPIQVMNARLKEIAQGESDLTQEITVKSRDEFGEMASSFNQMLAKLRELMKQITINAHQVAAASSQLSASSEETTKATEQITASVQEVAVGSDQQVMTVKETKENFQELAHFVLQISDSSQMVSNTALQASEKVVNGNQIVINVIKALDEINETVSLLSLKVQRLDERSAHIQQMSGMITSIADQTNLLALNAAIEAARAGEHGKGFAVVADEVRKLAEESSRSAEQINSVITASISDTKETVESMAATTVKVTSGRQMVQEVGSLFGQIEEAIQQVTTQIQEVTVAVQQLAENTYEMEQNMEIITEISNGAASSTQIISASTEEQLATMEEMMTSTESLAKQAEELQDLISKFKV